MYKTLERKGECVGRKFTLAKDDSGIQNKGLLVPQPKHSDVHQRRVSHYRVLTKERRLLAADLICYGKLSTIFMFFKLFSYYIKVI